MTPRSPALASLTALVLGLLSLPMGSRAWEPDVSFAVPIPLPPRPFLLVDAPRRYTPREPAVARLQLRRGGRVRLTVSRVLDPSTFVHTETPSQGIALEDTPLGAELERLSTERSPLPRRGSLVSLVGEREVTLGPATAARDAHEDESGAYESFEQDEGQVETWGVVSDRWSNREVSLGLLPPGLYVVRAVVGAWASSALLSVGSLTVLARRGDAHDLALVTDAEGRAQEGVEVVVRTPSHALGAARTDARGEARFPARDAASLRFVARRGDDVAWADVAHARMEPCDVRVYLAAGRSVFRLDEDMFVRGHVRGCVEGRSVPLSDEPVRLSSAGSAASQVRSLTTDRDGNFVAVIPAGPGDLLATVRGREHGFPFQLDARELPHRALHLTLEPPWAASGETVVATVADDEGGWPAPASAVLVTPTGELRAELGPGRPAVLRYTLPETSDTLSRVDLTALVESPEGVVLTRADLWTGRHPTLLSLGSERAWAAQGQGFSVHLRASDLGGAALTGSVSLALRGTDGNRPRGAARWSRALTLDTRGEARETVPLTGQGPWWLEATRGGASASLVVWERPRPATLSSRGALTVLADALRVEPGDPLGVTLVAPARGGTWVTLEQGSVWASALVGPGGAGPRFTVPEAARGLATVVATHVEEGRVSSSTAVTEVASARRLALTVDTDRRVYQGGETARVTVTSRDLEGAPRDGVLSLWLSDEGYYDLAVEDEVPPEAFFVQPGRRSDAGDSTRPPGYGAEGGRRHPTRLAWNGRPLPGSTFRHAWGYGGETVALQVRGDLGVVVGALARAAGFPRAVVCEARARALGTVSLEAAGLPWDLVAERVATATGTWARVDRGTLELSCEESMEGYGSRGASRGRGRGSLGPRMARQQRMEGTLFFLGAHRLGPEGRYALELPLPEQPGRWRVEALVIADDGGGARAHAGVSTTRPLEARLSLPPSLSVGDVTRGAASVHAPALAGRSVSVAVTLPRWLSRVSPFPDTVTLDALGRATVPLVLRAEAEGEHEVTLTASAGDPPTVDAVRETVTVREHHAVRPLAVRAVLGPEATVVDVPLPPLSEPAVLDVRVDADLTAAFDQELSNLSRSGWTHPAWSLARWRSLDALRGVLPALPPDARAVREGRLTRALVSELGSLRTLSEVGAGAVWWRGLDGSPLLASLALGALGGPEDAPVRRRLAGVVRAAAAVARRAWAAPLAYALATSPDPANGERDRALALALARGVQPEASGELEPSTWLLRAFVALGERGEARRQSELLRALVERRLERDVAVGCEGFAWRRCYAEEGARGALARAALELLRDEAPGARALGGRVARWLSLHPSDEGGNPWRTDEADALSLLASLGPLGATEGRFEVRSSGAVVARGDARSGATVVTRSASLQVVFPAVRGRLARVRVDGVLRLASVEVPAGSAGLVRRIEPSGEGRALVLELTLPRDAERVELTVPLPAGLAPVLARRAREAVREREAEPFDGFVFDRTPDDPRPTLEHRASALVVRYRSALAGRRVLRVPLSRGAPGDYTAGPAWLTAGAGALWAVTPPLAVSLP